MNRYRWAGFHCLMAALIGASVFADDARSWKAPPYACRKRNPIAADESSVAAGKAIYESQCLCCHGAGGRGDGPDACGMTPAPCNLRDPGCQAQSDGAMFWKLSTGRAPMPDFEKLLPDEKDRWDVVNYLRTLASSCDTPSATQPTTQP